MTVEKLFDLYQTLGSSAMWDDPERRGFYAGFVACLMTVKRLSDEDIEEHVIMQWITAVYGECLEYAEDYISLISEDD